MKTLIKVLIILGIGVNASFGWNYMDTVTFCEKGEVILGNSKVELNTPPVVQWTANTFTRACIDPVFFMNAQDVIIPPDYVGSNYRLDKYIKGTFEDYVPSRKWVEFRINFSIPVKKQDSLIVSKTPKVSGEGWDYHKIKRDSSSCIDFIKNRLKIPFEHKEIQPRSSPPLYKTSSLPFSNDIIFAKFRMACPEKVVLNNKFVFDMYKKRMNDIFPDTAKYYQREAIEAKRKLVDYTYGKEPPPEHTTNIKKVVFNRSIQDKIFLINGRKFYK